MSAKTEKTETKTSGGDDVYSAFHKLQTFARDLNTQLEVPEIVVFGRRGHGKSSVVEALLGFPFSSVGNAPSGVTLRPVAISVVNNPNAVKPVITIKRDSSPQFSSDQVVQPGQLQVELENRNSKTNVPIQVQYEYKNAWNVTIIDTPPLPADLKDNKTEAAEELVLSLAKPSHRILLAVEEVKEGGQSELVSFVKTKLDPKLDRTLFAFTKFSEQLKGFTSSRDLNRYLSSVSSSEATSFFTSLPTGEVRLAADTKEKYFAKLEEMTKEDLANLEQLQYDRRYANFVGMNNLRKHLQEMTWQRYQTNVPELLKRLRFSKKRSEERLAQLENQIKSMNSNKLRGNASKFVMQFLQMIEKLLVGTLEGNPGLNGQTLAEEKSQDEAGEWMDADFCRIEFNPDEWKVPHHNSKLYGGQQLERLLAEFKSVVEHTQIQELSMDDIATATGPQKLNNAINSVWAASDIVQRQISRSLNPLLDQLFKRAVYIAKRLVEVVDTMIEAERKSRKRGSANDETEQYPFFTHAVKDLFYKFVDRTAEVCKSKCRDEFLSTRIIYWERTALDGKDLKVDQNNSDVKKVVSGLADDLFVKIRDRIARNVVLKAYNFFLVPMQTELWTEIQGSITCLSDSDLKELFEVDATVKKLEADESDMKLILGRFAKQESLLKQYASDFSNGDPKSLEL